MIRALRWLWLVLPPGWVVALLVLGYLVQEGFWLWVGIDMGTVPDLWRKRTAVACMIAALYGLFRAVAFHPLFRPEYRKWLESTPWASRHALPVGPIQLVPQDLVVVGALTLMLHWWQWEALYVPVAFAFAYQAAIALSLWPTGLRWQCYLILLVLGAAVRAIQHPPVALAVLVGLYGFTHLAIRRCLERFPWQLPEWWPRLDFKLQPARDDLKIGQKGLGWPYDLLRPTPRASGVRLADGTAVSLLLGWWFYAIAANVSANERGGLIFFATAIVIVAAAGRLAFYCENFWWPISLWGRIWTGRWIIPAYDRVLAAPLLAVTALFSGTACLIVWGREYSAGPGLLAAIPMWILLCAGPNLAAWQLTGGHRIGMNRALTDKTSFTRL